MNMVYPVVAVMTHNLLVGIAQTALFCEVQEHSIYDAD